jgi:hypothetical protein
MRGLSIWMFSKIVMLVFLIATFSIVMGFLRLTNDRVVVDSAEAIAMQIKDTVQTTLYTNTISSTAIVPIPRGIPETEGSVQTAKSEAYTVIINKTAGEAGEDIVYVAIGIGKNPAAFLAASSFLTSYFIQNPNMKMFPPKGLTFYSTTTRYFIVTKDTASKKVCLQNCSSADFGSSCSGCGT